MTEAVPTKPRSRIWKWVRRLLMVLIVLVVSIVVFHRPLLRWALMKGGPWAAQTQGVTLGWNVAGSFLGDLTLTSVEAGGGRDHWMPNAHLGRLELDYDLWKLIQDGPSAFLSRVIVHDADIEIDLRHLPPSEPLEMEPPSKEASGPPPLVWPDVLDLHNLNVHLTLGDGSQITLQGFSFRGGEGTPGVIEIGQFSQEPDGMSLSSVKGQLEWQRHRIAIRNLKLPLDLSIQSLLVDLSKFEESGDLMAELDAGVGNGKIHLEAAAFGLNQEKADLDLLLQTLDLRAEDLYPLGLPDTIAFESAALVLKANGDPRQADTLDLETNITVKSTATAGTTIDLITTEATLKEGAFLLDTTIQHAKNDLAVNATANLPEQWADWEKTDWKATASGHLPDAMAFLDEKLPFTGLVQLKAQADGRGATPRAATANVTGDTWAWEQWKLPEFATDLAINGDQATVSIPKVPLGNGNELSANATLQLKPPMPTSVDWSLTVTDPQALLTTTGLGNIDATASGSLSTKGNARFEIEPVGQGDYSNVNAQVSVEGQEIVYDEARIESLDMQLAASDGLARLKSLNVQVDPSNAIAATGQAELKKPWAFDVDADVRLPELTRFNALLKSFGAPGIDSGSVTTLVKAKGTGDPWSCDGTASASVMEFSIPSLPEAVGLEFNSTFAGTKAEIDTLTITMGDWRLETRGNANEKRVDLQRLALFQADRQLLAGNLALPYDIIQEDSTSTEGMEVRIDVSDLPVSEVLAAAGIQDMPGGRLHAEIDLKGRPDTAEGHIKLNWRDLTLPQSPLNLKPAQFEWETTLADDQVTSKGSLDQPPLKLLTLAADVPLSLAKVLKDPDSLMKAPITSEVKLPKSDLSFLKQLAPDAIKDLPLTLSVDVHVSGELQQPKINAAIDADAKEVAFTKTDLPSVRDVKVRIRSEDSLVRIEDISATLAGGRVKLDGSIDAKNPAEPLFDLDLTAREALVFRDPDTSVRANADIAVNGTMQSSRVSGTVEAVRGRVFKEIDFVPLAVPNPDLPAEPPSTARAEKELVLPEAIKDWTFDVDIRTRDPIRISGNIAVGSVSADVHLGGTGAKPLLTGNANIDEALLQLPFSRMSLTKGVVTLNPNEPFNPDLDIRGVSRIGRYDITLFVYGASVNPKTRFTSVPPLSEADIATLIATGTTLDGSASEVASEATSRAAFLLASQLYRKVFNKRKKISEEPPKLSMTFNPSGADRQNDSVQATYEVTPKVRVTGRFRQNGQMKMMLGYLLRFGEAARAMDEPESPAKVEEGETP